MKTLHIDSNGWMTSPNVEILSSPHFNERPDAEAPSLIVLHNISLPAGEFGTPCVKELFLGTLDTTKDERLADLVGLRVASHFFIDRRGKITQFVACLDRAWHAGVSSFMGRENCNDFSIGIELEGTDFVAFEEAQYKALAVLLKTLVRYYPVKAVVAHSDIAPGRKTDPGIHFDWNRVKRDLKDTKVQFPGLAASIATSLRHATAGETV